MIPFSSILICPRCRGQLGTSGQTLRCAGCLAQFGIEDGIADFSGGNYYDEFTPGQELPQSHLEGLELENEGVRRRIDDFYLPLLRSRFGSSAIRVLDCGCGSGLSVDLLIERGVDAWGNDLSSLRKWQWRERRNRERLVVADGRHLPFDDSSFDVIIASGVVEHIGVSEGSEGGYRVRPLGDRDVQRREFLRGLLRALKREGILFLDFPNGAFPIDFWHGDSPGAARAHRLDEGFLPTFTELHSLLGSLDSGIKVSALSPRGRLQFRQASAHWYGRLFRVPMALLFTLMSMRGFRWLARSPLNPFLVVEVRMPRRG